MLVLSRKVDQQIMIGDDIQLTVVRLDGNRVRIGISAPRDVRILRGELAAKESVEIELSEREFAFAHQEACDKIAKGKQRLLDSTEPRVFSGSVATNGSKVKLNASSPDGTKSAPLASFVSAS